MTRSRTPDAPAGEKLEPVGCLCADPDLDIARLDQARRLWMRADSDVGTRILAVEL